MATKAELLLGQIVRCAQSSKTPQEFDQAYRTLVVAAEPHAVTTNAPWELYPQNLQLGEKGEPLTIRWAAGATHSIFFHLRMEDGTVTFIWDRWALNLTFNDVTRDFSFCFNLTNTLADAKAPTPDSILMGWLLFLDKGAEMHPVVKKIFEYANVT